MPREPHGPSAENQAKYLEAKKLVDGGMPVYKACEQVGFAYGTYASCAKWQPKQLALVPSAGAPQAATQPKPRKASPRLVHLPVPETPASGDREVTVAIIKMRVSEIGRLFNGEQFNG